MTFNIMDSSRLTRRQGCLSRPLLCYAFAVLQPRQSSVRHEFAIQRAVSYSNLNAGACYGTGLSRSQEGRRQKRIRRRAAPESSGWSASEPASSRSEWLQRAKAQSTEVLLATLLSPEAVPLARLPVLLTLVEGRPDLEDCLRTAGLPAVASAVVRSEMLQRLLPGGNLLELLSSLVEERARAMTASELLPVAEMVAAWRPPASCELLGPAAAAVAAALVERCQEQPTATARVTTTATPVEGISGAAASGRSGAATVAEADADAEAAVLAEALAVLRPWLQWRAGGVAGAGGGGSDVGDGVSSGGWLAAGMEELADELGSVRTAVAQLLRRLVSVRAASVDPAAAAAAEAAGVLGVLAAAVQYGVEVPAGFVKAAAVAASAPSSSPQIAAQLVAQACSFSSGISLTGSEVRDLVAARLAPQLGASEHALFLTTLLGELRKEGLRPPLTLLPQSRDTAVPTGGTSGAAAAAAAAVEEGLWEVLGSAAGRLGGVALALAMECVAETAPSGAAARKAAEAEVDAARQLLAAAGACVAQHGQEQRGAAAGGFTPDEICRLAAAAVRLQQCSGVASGGSGAAAAAAAVLDAVRTESLQAVSLDAAAALVAAAWKPVPAPPEAGDGADGADGTAAAGVWGSSTTPSLGMSGPVLDALLERIASGASASTPTPAARRRGQQPPPPAAEAPTEVPPPAPALSYNQAEGVFAAVVAAAEADADAAPSTSDAVAAAAAVPVRARPPTSSGRLGALRAAALVACRALAPAVRQLDSAAAVHLLYLAARADECGVRPDHPQLLWALHERLRALAAAGDLSPGHVLDVLRSCVLLRWRPAVLLREMLLPLLRELQSSEGGSEHDDPSAYAGGASRATAAAAAAATEVGMRAGGGRVDGGDQGAAAARRWTPGNLKDALALLAKLQLRGRLAEAVVKSGVVALLRSSAATEASAALGASDLSLLLWVCAVTRYRGATVLRPLLQRLLQVPPAQVSMKAAARAVWAAVRLDVVGERLVRWALASCQGDDKLAAAPPQSLANLCWGLAKLGVRPPRAFVTAAAAATRSQLRGFKAQELATLLFVLATWGGQLGGGAAEDAGDAVVRHLVMTRAAYDGPALCTAVWALQRLTARPLPPTTAAAAAGFTAAGSAAVPADAESELGASGVLDAGALRAFEDRLIAVGVVADPRVGFPDHHLLRFFSACAAAGYRPERLLRRYISRLQRRLRSLRGVPPASAPAAAEARSRMLWSAARILATFELRDPQLLASLELCAERCQSLLRPGHLAGLLNAMAALGYYPARWAERGLMRRVGLALRSATVTETGLLMEALAAWRPYLTAAPAASIGLEEEAGGESAGLGNGRGSAGEAEEVEVEGGTHRLRGPTPQRVDLLRRVALARLTQLCVPPPEAPAQKQPAASPQPPAAAAAGDDGASAALPSSGATAPTGSTAAAAPPAPAAAATPATAAAAAPPQAADARGSSPATADVESRDPRVGLDDAMRILTALAKLRWDCPPVVAALMLVAARLPLERRRRVPELTTLMWALASLRQDAPELLEDLQAALLGLPPQPSLEEEMALLELGRASSVRVADSITGAAAAAGAATAAGAAAAAAAAAGPSPGTAPAASQSSGQGQAPREPDGQAVASGGAVTQSAATAPLGSSPAVGDVSGSEVQAEGVPATLTAGGSTSGGSAGASTSVEGTAAVADGRGEDSAAGAVKAPRGAVQLLSRPFKPALPAEEDPGTAGGAAPGGGAAVGAAASASFDPAAAMVAAAAEVNERFEQQLGGPMGRAQLSSEPWSPADIFKTLWSCAKMNRHPGPMILAAAERGWLSYTANGVAAGAADAPPLHTITGLLWSLSVFRHHNGSFAQRLAEQLATWLRDGDTGAAAGASAVAAVAAGGSGTESPQRAQAALEGPEEADGEGAEQRRRQQQLLLQEQQQQRLQAFAKQGVQVAACLLAAQADRVDSPLNTTLPPEVRARLVAAWRSRLAQRLAKPPNRYQLDLVSVLRKMGFTAAANVATPDGCALVDVAVLRQSAPQMPGSAAPGAPSPPPPPPRLLALELLGRHNSAANNPRILGEAVIKYRLLQARGYLVVPIPCYEWDRINHKDVWTKMVYLQAKIDRRAGGLTAGAGSPTAAAAASAGGAAPAAGSVAVAGSSAVTAVDTSSGRAVGNGSSGGNGSNGGNDRSAVVTAGAAVNGGQVVNVLGASWERGGSSSSSG